MTRYQDSCHGWLQDHWVAGVKVIQDVCTIPTMKLLTSEQHVGVEKKHLDFWKDEGLVQERGAEAKHKP